MPWADSGLGSPPTAGVTIGRGFSHGWAHFDFGGIPARVAARRDIVSCVIAANKSARDRRTGPNLVRVIDRNIHALLERRQAEQRARGIQERVADAMTRFAGSMMCVYFHLVVFGMWIIINLGWVPGVPRFDPTFVALAMVASVEAIFLSTFVLITQNRMQGQADQRADLDLHVSLLAEHEITRLIALVAAMAKHMGVDEANTAELVELQKDVRPESVMREIQKEEGKMESQKHKQAEP